MSDKIFEGVPEFMKALRGYERKLGIMFSVAAKEAAEDFLEQNDEFVPMDTGALRRSRGTVQVGSGWSTVTYVGYGFEISELYVDASNRIRIPREYAVWQHEVPAYHAHGIDHYLEEGILAYQPIIVSHIHKRLSRVKP